VAASLIIIYELAVLWLNSTRNNSRLGPGALKSISVTVVLVLLVTAPVLVKPAKLCSNFFNSNCFFKEFNPTEGTCSIVPLIDSTRSISPTASLSEKDAKLKVLNLDSTILKKIICRKSR